MSGLPSPQDIAVKILVWLSAPAVIVTLYTSFLAAIGWYTVVRASVRYTGVARGRVKETARHWTSSRQRSMVRLLAASTGFVGVAYSLSQLAGVTYEKINHGESIASGFSFDAGFLVSRLLGYQHLTPLSVWTFVGALASIFALNFANLTGIKNLRKFIELAWRAALGLGVLLSLLLALDGAFVLVLGLTHSNNYRPSMALLYGLWVCCLWVLPCLAYVIDRASEEIFSV